MPGFNETSFLVSFKSLVFMEINCQDASILYKYINPNLLAVASEDVIADGGS